ncbi:hypothetical protein IV203_003062 [Nitzschia inconspicua]|uniref:Uncharacterized protein n=1 Tax=Nitzschia inconspicua TaxID=303405 RepID=A0A9K3L1J3_9STRA|nr:hypothetical protein IV203_003062 [Nitzschia inconspicua]
MGGPSEKPPVGQDRTGVETTRRRGKTDRMPRETTRGRTSSFSTSCSQSTISSKLPAQWNVPAAPQSSTQDTGKHPLGASQTVLSKKPPTTSRQQKIMAMMRRARSSGVDSRRMIQRPKEEVSTPNQTESRLPRVRSFSSSRPNLPKSPSTTTKSNPYGNSGIVSRHSVGIPRVSTPNSRASLSHHSLGSRNSYVPRSVSSALRMDSSASRQGSISVRNVFHVRLSIGYMTGLEMEKIAKWTRQPSNRHIVVGFVELASSGKYTALSQPLLSNIGDGPARVSKILWANPRGGRDISKLRRRLHFSLQLERELPFDAREDQRDDDSFTSLGSYSPEVVKLLVGLKCGDERLDLGFAKLVINGRETVEQKMDLIVQPAAGTSMTKNKRGLFGKKQCKNCFTNGDHSFKITPNAILRVKADIRAGLPGQDGASIWGKDDSSYTTAWTYDTSTSFPMSPHAGSYSGAMVNSSSFGMMPPRSYGIAHTKEKHILAEKAGHKDSSLFGESPTAMQYDPTATVQPRVIHTVPPISVVTLQKKEDKSYMSGLTGPEVGCSGNWWSKGCTSILCGDVEYPNRGCRGLVAKSFSFDNISQRLSDDIQASSDSTSTDDSSTEPAKDFKGAFVKIRNDADIATAQPKERTKTRPIHHDTKERVETLDVTIETYNDLKDAQETLMRYANRVGKNMDQLLDDMEHSQKISKKRSEPQRRSLRL